MARIQQTLSLNYAVQTDYTSRKTNNRYYDHEIQI